MMCGLPLIDCIALAEFLILQGDTAKAREVLMACLTKMPDIGVRYDYTTAQSVALLLEVGEKEKAIEIATTMAQRADELATYYESKGDYGRELQVNVIIMGELQRSLYQYGEADLAKSLEEKYEKHAGPLQMRMNQ